MKRRSHRQSAIAPPFTLRSARRICGWLAAVYPRRSACTESDAAMFLDDALTDAWADRGWTGLVSVGLLAARDLAGTWMGRAALPISRRSTSGVTSRRLDNQEMTSEAIPGGAPSWID